MTYQPQRIDGVTEWAKISPDVQSRIGAAAIDLIACWVGVDGAPGHGGEPVTAETRAFEAADNWCSDRLLEAVTENVPAIDVEHPPLPAILGNVCQICGCSHDDPCEEGCGWQAANLCSSCSAQHDLAIDSVPTDARNP